MLPYGSREGGACPLSPKRNSSDDNKKLLMGAYGRYESKEELSILREILIKFSPFATLFLLLLLYFYLNKSVLVHIPHLIFNV